MPSVRKSLEIEILTDNSSFSKSVDEMRSKLDGMVRDLNRTFNQSKLSQNMGKQGMGNMINMPNSQEIQKAKRELDGFIRDQAREYEKLRRLAKDQETVLSKLPALKKDSSQAARDELTTEERKLSVLKQQMDLREKTIRGALDVKQGNASTPLLERDLKAPAMQVAKIFGTAFGAAMLGSKLWERYQSMPMQTTQMAGAATKGLYGSALQGLSSGDIVNQSAFSKERAESMRMAQSKMDSTELTSRMISPTALAGSALSGLGFKGIGGRLEESFEADRMKKMTDDFTATFQAKVDSNPLKGIAANTLEQNYLPDLATQRMLGVNNKGYHGRGGFKDRATESGFTPDMAAAMATQMQGAGASTRGMQELTPLAMQAQRGFDLTNAGSVMGRVSGGAGGGNASAQIFKKIMEESVKAGLDKSEFREEQRRFADATSEIMNRAGVKTGEDAERLLAGFSRALGGSPTTREMEGAKSAYGQYQQGTGETSGRGGALQASAFLKNPKLKQIGYSGFSNLMEMHSEDLTSTNERVISAAVAAGMTPNELVDTVQKEKGNMMLQKSGVSSKGPKRLQDKGLTGKLTYEQLKKLKTSDPESYEAYQESVNAPGRTQEYQDPATSEAMSKLFRTTGMTSPEMSPEDKAALDKKYKGGGTGRIEDDLVADKGVMSQKFLESFREFSGELVPATEALKGFAGSLVMISMAAKDVPDAEKATFMRGQMEHLIDTHIRLSKGTKSQPTGGSGK